jgi:hypothetical protein
MDRLPMKRHRLGNIPVQHRGNPNVGIWDDDGGVFTQVELPRSMRKESAKIGEFYLLILYKFVILVLFPV